MKKLLLLGAFGIAGLVSAQTSGLKGSVHVGLPVGDVADFYSLNLGVDLAYLWPVATNFQAGITTGYSAWIGKETTVYGYTVKPSTVSQVPIAATGNYNITSNFAVGLDLGYALTFANGENDGGFYVQPKVGYNFGNNQLYLGYSSVSNDGSANAVNLGFSFHFGN